MTVAASLQAASVKTEHSSVSFSGGLLQRKLIIGASNDPLEQEADRVSEQVLATPEHLAFRIAPPRIQRLFGRPVGKSDVDVVPSTVEQALASRGRPLEPGLRRDMERRFGHDFSRVRVHCGAVAEQSACDVNANAYTVGNNIVFDTGQYAPGKRRGRWLIAHELAHVLQQSAAERMDGSSSRLVAKVIRRKQRKQYAHVDCVEYDLKTHIWPSDYLARKMVRNAGWLLRDIRDGNVKLDRRLTDALQGSFGTTDWYFIDRFEKVFTNIERAFLTNDYRYDCDYVCPENLQGETMRTFGRWADLQLCMMPIRRCGNSYCATVMIHELAHNYLGLKDGCNPPSAM
jgi:hypothetical protein